MGDHHTQSLRDVAKLVGSKVDFELVIKRLARSTGKGHRETKTYTCTIKIDEKLGLGLKLAEIQSGLGNRASKTFLYVKGLTESKDGSAGPALKAGVRQHDLIIEVNGVKV